MSKSKTSFSVLLGAALALMAASAFAGEITLYQDQDFHGGSITAHGAIPNLDRIGFNDRASSMVIRDGVWEACTDANFQGRCTQLQPGNYPSLRGSLNDSISSVREIAAAAPVPPPAAVISNSDARIVLFEHRGYSTRSVELTSNTRDLARVGFTDRADAAIVHGGVWRLCDSERFRGECAEFGPGRYDSLGSLKGRVRSAELVAAAGAPPVSVAPPPGAARVVLYERPGFGGRSIVIDRPQMANLDRIGFNDRAASMRVEGGSWMLCTDARFEGECRTFGPGEYPRLPFEVNRKVSSVRLVGESYSMVR